MFILCLMMLCAHLTKAQFSGQGSGTVDDPYLVSTALNVEEIRYYQGKNVTFKLTKDIDMSELIEDTYSNAGWNPLPNFKGELDGNGYTISGLFINRPSVEMVGFFQDMTNAKVHDLILDYSGDVIGGTQVGGLCGSLDDCNIERNMIKGKKISGYIAGGLLGVGRGAIIKECIVECNNVVSGKDFDSRCGGLVGFVGALSTSCEIYNNRVSANIMGGHKTGGIVGETDNKAGFVACNIFEGNIESLYSDVSCSGGIVGYHLGNYNFYSNVVISEFIKTKDPSNDYIGRISGTSSPGLSYPTATNANRAYNQMKLNERYPEDSPENGMAVGKFLLKNGNMYRSMGWDLDNVWTIDEGKAYPRLRWEVERESQTPPLLITHQNVPVDENDVLTFEAEKVTTNVGGGITYIYYQCIPDEPLITNISSSTQQVTVTISSEDYSHLKWAGINGEDADMATVSESRSCQLERGASIPLKLHAIFADQDFTSYTATVEVSCDKFTRTFQIVFSNDNSVKPVCPKPVIDYVNGKLTFSCDAESTPKYHVTITNSDANSFVVDGELPLERTYIIDVYATAEGFQASESSRLYLYWTDSFVTDDYDGMIEERGLPVQIQSNNGLITISGVTKGVPVSVYSLGGVLLDSTTSLSEVVTLNVSTSTHLVILKICDKSIKVSF